MKLKYNSPVILTFTFLSSIVLLIDSVTGSKIIPGLFTVPGEFAFNHPLDYLRIFTHAAGHANWMHLVGNFSLVLLLGPILEEKYGSRDILLMMLATAGITGILNVVFFDSGLLGASGIVFMLILLSSFSNFKSGEIPITFILVVALYLGQEIYRAVTEDNQVSEFAHIIGGAIGGVFGFLVERSKGGKKPATDKFGIKIE